VWWDEERKERFKKGGNGGVFILAGASQQMAERSLWRSGGWPRLAQQRLGRGDAGADWLEASNTPHLARSPSARPLEIRTRHSIRATGQPPITVAVARPRPCCWPWLTQVMAMQMQCTGSACMLHTAESTRAGAVFGSNRPEHRCQETSHPKTGTYPYRRSSCRRCCRRRTNLQRLRCKGARDCRRRSRKGALDAVRIQPGFDVSPRNAFRVDDRRVTIVLR
jgi:hypothetical protein